MDFLKQWTFCVCLTLIISVIFSLLTPKGKMGNFYKIIISLFIFISFLYPMKDFEFKDISYSQIFSETDLRESSEKSAQIMINNQVKKTLQLNGIEGANVKCSVRIDDNIITVKSVEVAVADEYDLSFVEEIIFDSLSINARVIHIGQ